jgi:RNA polymerase sigma-70 factor, ECF subfamily
MGVSPADVEDVVQDVFLRAQAKFDEIRHERGFLFQTCVYVIGHLHRRAHRRREVADEKRIKAEIDVRATPEEDAVESEARTALQRILDIMPDDLRAVFVLFELEGLTTPEIAELVDAPVGTVASRLRRARELFATYAESYEQGAR